MTKFNVFILSLAFLFGACSHKAEKVDLIVHNATIYSVDVEFNTFEAMAISDGKIVELGPERQILNKYRSDQTFDAKGQTIYPGFIDAHCHFYNYGVDQRNVDLVGSKSYEDVVQRVLEHQKNSPTTSGWILGRGWDQNDWKNNSYPHKRILDSIYPNTAVILRRIGGHAALVNQTALDMAGITAETVLVGGMVHVEEGEPTGVLIDNAVDLVLEKIPSPSRTEQIEALKLAEQNCFSVGLTTLDDAGLSKSIIELIDSLQKTGDLQMRVYAMLTDNEENFAHYLKAGPYKSERLNVRSFKFYADGALGSRGACLKTSYTDKHDHVGLILKDIPYYKERAQQLFNAGFQMNTHAIGDSANRLICDIYGSVLKGQNDKRWRIEHAQIIEQKDFKLFAEYSIVPSVQTLAATSDMYWAEDRIGAERIKGGYAYKDLLDQNGMIALGTDFPVEVIDPLKTFYAGIARKDESGFPKDGYQMENALSRKETLMGMTIWAAVSNFEEDEKGSLEPGKLADFVILNGDIMKVDESLLHKVHTVATFLNGVQVYDN